MSKAYLKQSLLLQACFQLKYNLEFSVINVSKPSKTSSSMDKDCSELHLRPSLPIICLVYTIFSIWDKRKHTLAIELTDMLYWADFPFIVWTHLNKKKKKKNMDVKIVFGLINKLFTIFFIKWALQNEIFIMVLIYFGWDRIDVYSNLICLQKNK